jgi:glycine/D-amino acid oxidase-like deaminating enzyme
MRECIIVGGGIIGATIAKTLGMYMNNILLIDADLPMAGTAPSGGHLKPSWFGGMKKEEYSPSMDLLDNTWGILSEEFDVVTIGVRVAKAKVYRVDTDYVTKWAETHRTLGAVQSIENVLGRPVVTVKDIKGLHREECELLIVATGVWAVELVDWKGVSVQAKQGVSFRMKGRLPQPFIIPWAPYKQIVAHQQTDNSIWIGDGSAILSRNWNEERTQSCLARCQKALGRRLVAYRNNPPDPLQTRRGLRAYCTHSKEEPCLYQQLGPNCFLVTGAGKSGTIAAGFAAHKLLKHVGAI